MCIRIQNKAELSQKVIDQVNIFDHILEAQRTGNRLFSILIDPENIQPEELITFVKKTPSFTTHLLVGGSTATHLQTHRCVEALKKCTQLPIVLFPGSHEQITPAADALLFLSLLSGRNPEYLIEQQLKAVPSLKKLSMEIIPTAYLLIEGGRMSSVERTSGTSAMRTDDVEAIVHTALAGQYSGKKLIYLETGSGAINPVPLHILREVCQAVSLPVIVGGGIKSTETVRKYHSAGATMVVVGTGFEKGGNWIDDF